MGLIPIIVIIILSWLTPPIACQAIQRHAGRMVSPTEFAHIHYFRSPSDVETQLDNIDAWLNEREKQMKLKVAPEKARQAMNTIAKKTSDKIGILKKRALELKAQMTAGPARTKRAAGLIAAAGAIVAISVVALGLGIKNSIELARLTDQVNHLEEANNQIIVSLEEHAAKAQRNFEALNRTLNNREWQVFLEETKMHIYEEVHDVDRKIDQWTSAFYHVLKGNLDPAFVSVEDLATGIDLIAKKAAAVGMKPVPFETPLEVFFSAPVSAVLNATGVHIIVSIPIMPVHAPVLDVLQVSHTPIPMGNGTFVDLQLPKDYIVTDPQRTMHKEMSPAELSACTQHKNTYFCREHTFSRKPTTCTAAVLHGDKETAAKACEKTLIKTPVLIVPVPNKTFDVVLHSNTEQTITKVCPGKGDTPLQRFRGKKTITMGPGCFLRTDNTVSFNTNKLPEEEVACHTESWEAADLLEGEDIDYLGQLLRALPEEDVRVNLRHLLKNGSSPGTAVMMACLAVATAIAVGLLGRYVWLCAMAKRAERKADVNTQTEQPDNQPPPTPKIKVRADLFPDLQFLKKKEAKRETKEEA